MSVPTSFPQWNPAIDGLEDAGNWATEIERSRLPSNIVFPRRGQVWQVIRDCEARFRACFSQPLRPDKTGFYLPVARLTQADFMMLMGFGTGKLRRGEHVRVLEIDPRPLAVPFAPLRYHDLETTIVPTEIRQDPRYQGYQLSLKTAKTISDLCLAGQPSQDFFTEVFHLVEDVA